jgi:hypothetical protein
MGEPLTWKFFNEGIQRLKRSEVIGHIGITTNGILLDRIHAATWEAIDSMIVSVYPGFSKQALLDDMIAAHGDKIRVNPPRRPGPWEEVGLI